MDSTDLRSRKVSRPLVIGAGVWLLLVAGGVIGLIRASLTPGLPAQAKASIEEHSTRVATRAKLLMFVHSKCPCSQASLEELENLQNAHFDQLETTVYFSDPLPEADQSALWATAQNISGVQVIADTDGAFARLHQVKTSGQTLLYSADGQLKFSGGITPSRGHIGASAGRSAIESYLTTGTPSAVDSPVFGCKLR